MVTEQALRDSARGSAQKKRLEGPLLLETSGGRQLYAFAIETFPRFFNNIYVLDDGQRRVLFDCGSGFGSSNDNLVLGLASLEDRFGKRIALSDIDTVILTHAHTDHFGGLEFVRQHTAAPIGIHTLDRRVLSHYEERVLVAAKSLEMFLALAGVSESRRAVLMNMYKAPKGRFHSLPVDFTLEEGEAVPDGRGGTLEVEVYHVPGHCPGQVCIRIDDVLLTADHVLARITPHQSPESITLNMGLLHYLDSLGKIERLGGIRVGLGGHEAPIDSVAERIGEIRRSHDQRLDQILELCAAPQTTAELSRHLFGKVSGYIVLQALEETGAHVEYLYLRGALVAANVEELEDQVQPAIRYLRA